MCECVREGPTISCHMHKHTKRHTLHLPCSVHHHTWAIQASILLLFFILVSGKWKAQWRAGITVFFPFSPALWINCVIVMVGCPSSSTFAELVRVLHQHELLRCVCKLSLHQLFFISSSSATANIYLGKARIMITCIVTDSPFVFTPTLGNFWFTLVGWLVQENKVHSISECRARDHFPRLMSSLMQLSTRE